MAARVLSHAANVKPITLGRCQRPRCKFEPHIAAHFHRQASQLCKPDQTRQSSEECSQREAVADTEFQFPDSTSNKITIEGRCFGCKKSRLDSERKSRLWD